MHDMFALVNDIISEEVIDGLDRAVLNMKKREVALVTIPPEYAFDSTESKQDLAVVPPNSTVVYEVELVSFVKVRVRLPARCSS
jgi:FK506-binding protein 4/5